MASCYGHCELVTLLSECAEILEVKELKWRLTKTPTIACF